MSTNVPHDCRLCAALDIVTMKALPGGRFAVLEPTPRWWRTLLASSRPVDPGRPAEIFPYLEEFLGRWPSSDGDSDPPDLSGIWQESGPDGSVWLLEARWLVLDEQRYLGIERLRSASEDRSELLQRGRENQLRHEQFVEQKAELEMELRRAKDAAESLNLAKSRFLANVSHELRTPLHGILGMTAIAQKSNHSQRLGECLQAIQTSAQALLEIVTDLLDLSRVESGKLKLQYEPFSLTSLVSETIGMLRPSAEEKGLYITSDIDSQLPDRVLGATLRLWQILVNLIGNAIKFTEQGSI